MNRFRTPVQSEYAAALGYAVFIFATYEWNVACCGEKLSPGFLQAMHGKTAANIGKRFQTIVENEKALKAPLRARLLAVAAHFRVLVKKRDQLVHGKPCTDPQGRASLSFRSSAEYVFWSPELIADVTNEFESASIEANDILHHALP